MIELIKLIEPIVDNSELQYNYTIKDTLLVIKHPFVINYDDVGNVTEYSYYIFAIDNNKAVTDLKNQLVNKHGEDLVSIDFFHITKDNIYLMIQLAVLELTFIAGNPQDYTKVRSESIYAREW